MVENYKIKTKNIKSIIGYILLVVALSFYMGFLFQYMSVVVYILGIITFVVFGLYLIQDWFIISKRLMLKVIGISYVAIPILYKTFYFLKGIFVGKDLVDVIFGGFISLLVLILFGLLVAAGISIIHDNLN